MVSHAGKKGVNIAVELIQPTIELDQMALDEWNRVVSVLHEAGLVTKLDVALLERYCQTYSDICKLREYIDDEFGGMADYLKGKNTQTMPIVSQLNKLEDKLLNYMDRLCLTPAKRARITTPNSNNKKTENPLEKLIG